MALTICAVTSSRADWGLLAPVLALLRDDPAFHLQIVATGQHLMPAAGNTVQEITTEGFTVTRSVDMRLAGDTALAVTDSAAAGIAGLGAAMAALKPDILLILGDRYEILGAAYAATLARIPIAHLAGGDVTEGAMDDAFRHAITKLSHLHFVTTATAARRVRQLGEDPARIFVTGSPGIDRIKATPLLDRAAFLKAVGLPASSRFLMVTFHPETLSGQSVEACGEMLAALEQIEPDVALLFSGTNADVEGERIGRQIGAFAASRPNTVLHPSLGSKLYFSALAHADAIVGNSSSGLYEAPSFQTPTVNIGDRQKGRARAASVIDVTPRRAEILAAIAQARAMDCTGVENSYGDGHAATRIVHALKAVIDPEALLAKGFVDFPAAGQPEGAK